MGTLPTEMVAGKYYSIYDAYYKQVDPTNKGSVGAMDAAKFLKTSGLSDMILSKIWDLADSNGKGFLTRSGFFVALKLVALVQAGKEPTTGNLSLDVAPPQMGDKVQPPAKVSASPTLGESEWAMKPTEKMKYDQLFDSLNPANGYIPGSKVKGLLMDSKLPVDTLGKIWDLADMDKDGALDRHEFSVAMHLVYKALEKYAIPSCLPPELLPAGKKKDSISLPGAIPVLPAVPAMPAVPNGVDPLLKSVTPPLVPPPAPAPSKPPLIPGPTPPPLIPPVSATPPLIAPLSSSSPIPPIPAAVPIKPLTPPVQNAPGLPVSAAFPVDNFSAPVEEPWVISKEEKVKYDTLFEQADLDRDGFVSGHEIKDVFLKSGVAQPVLAHIWGLCDTAEQGKLNNEQFALALWLISRKLKGIDPPAKLTPEMIPPSMRKPSETQASNDPAVFTSQEVTRLSKEIETLVKEKLALETDITQREADIKIKAGEVKSLQGELDALVATLKQLENQKGEAFKRINDLKTQTAELESKIDDTKSELELEQIEVDKLRHQAEEQEKTLKQQESELNKKKQELDNLKKDESNLRKQRDNLKEEIAQITKSSGETDELIVEIKEKLIELEDVQKQLQDAIAHLDNVLETKNLTSLSEVYLHVEPKFRNESYSSMFSKIFKITGRDATDPFADMQEPDETDFSKTDAFAKDPFAGDPFAAKDSFQSNPSSNTGFSSDPFASFGSGSKKPDPFAATNPPAAAQANDQDAFGCDPFAILHAPTKAGSNLPSPAAPRSESPSPALPPKKSKQPPPRPAPPRPAPLTLPSGFDADFADFSGFTRKQVSTGFNSSTSTLKSDHSTTASSKDPFRDYRYDDPFEIADTSDEWAVPRGASAPTFIDLKNAFDPFVSLSNSSTPAPVPANGFSKSSTPISSPLPPEDQQIAWATAESVKAEKERRKKAAEQEKADYKLALKLSKQENKKRSFRSKILS
ncbi:epidermal growth factor receptor substrate 15-like 1 isoform X2 [Planococcus citri]|uniref:epidermal growth factor receptor substrate 15-like 1 isoform X2 n=1 Tax=Planococcus citri TaxID=170843 RepID=UPI0031F90F77